MMKSKIFMCCAIMITLLTVLIFNGCAPLKEFGTSPAYEGSNNYSYELPAYDSLKKTVVIVANNDGTELFDMMAPYYLFNATGRANVYIVAKKRFPVVVKKGFYLLPQATFSEIDSLKIKPDVIVIPFLAAADSAHQDPVIVNWIKNHYTANVNILAVCDGAATAAATGIFDGKPITAHASDYEGIKVHFSRPLWVQNTSVVNEGNLYSTAGVSNATEGSLAVINKLFGADIMHKVMDDVAYPHPTLKTEHQSISFKFGDKLAIGKKITCRKNKRLGVLLQEGINEFDLAGIMDTYNRTFPGSIKSFSANDTPVKTKYGLVIIPTGKSNDTRLDELHIIGPDPFSASRPMPFKYAEVVKYNNGPNQYIIDVCLQRINAAYGQEFQNIVKLMLDYN